MTKQLPKCADCGYAVDGVCDECDECPDCCQCRCEECGGEFSACGPSTYANSNVSMRVCDDCYERLEAEVECPKCEGFHDPALPCVAMSAAAEDRRALRV